MQPLDRKAIYAALAAPFPEDAIQRTYANDHVGPDGKTIKGTRKSYDTTGIGYQFVVNRLNEVLGVGGYRVERRYSVKEGTFSTGKERFIVHCEITLTLGEWVDGRWVPFAEAVGDGGHESITLADAVKGAYTNGLKKTAAMFGVGRQAYEGSLDDDNVPAATDKPAAPAKSGPRSANPIGDAMRTVTDPAVVATAVKSIGAMLASVDSAQGLDALYAEIQRHPKDVQTAIRKAHGDMWVQKQHETGWTAPTGKVANDQRSGGPSSDPEVKFGRSKGKRLSQCDDADLEWLRGAYVRDLDDPEKANFADKNRAMLDAIDAHLAHRRSQAA